MGLKKRFNKVWLKSNVKNIIVLFQLVEAQKGFLVKIFVYLIINL